LRLWVDAQLSPHLAPWLSQHFEIQAESVRYLNLRDAEDEVIFEAARRANAVVMTKDVDFVYLLERHGPPPSMLWITSGNTSNQYLRRLLSKTLIEALQLIEAGEPLVEISSSRPTYR